MVLVGRLALTGTISVLATEISGPSKAVVGSKMVKGANKVQVGTGDDVQFHLFLIPWYIQLQTSNICCHDIFA